MLFDSRRFGEQGLVDEDRAAVGVRYAELRSAVFRNAYYRVWGAADEPPLPVYDVSLSRVVRGLLPFGRPWQFRQAARRTVDSTADLRWGADGRGYRRLLHPNGVCLFGRWVIDRVTQYSGYFRQGSEGLIAARFSTCCRETRRGRIRSLSLAAKLFPTTDPEHSEPLQTAHLITQEDLGGTRQQRIHDIELRNNPDTTPWRRGFGLPILLLSGLVFKRVDRVPDVRQLYQIAELGKPPEAPTWTPRCVRLTIDSPAVAVSDRNVDFRDEVLAQIYDPGIPEPRRRLIFAIDVTDVDVRRGLLRRRVSFPEGWTRIGRIEFEEGVASYNGDFVFHLPHPPWRTDRNDPASEIRRPGTAARKPARRTA